MHHATLLFRLRLGIREKQALAAHDRGFENQHAAILAGIHGVDFLVERLLVDPRAVDKHGNDMGVPQAVALFPLVRFRRPNARSLQLGLL